MTSPTLHSAVAALLRELPQDLVVWRVLDVEYTASALAQEVAQGSVFGTQYAEDLLRVCRDLLGRHERRERRERHALPAGRLAIRERTRSLGRSSDPDVRQLAHDADRMLLLLEALLLVDHPESPLSDGDHAGAVNFLLQLVPKVRALLGSEGAPDDESAYAVLREP